MSEAYQSKRERWQQLLEVLPAELRKHVSLRNVEAVAALLSQAQERLVQQGDKTIEARKEILKEQRELLTARMKEMQKNTGYSRLQDRRV